jgi:predicted GNAT family acetyltransferase
MTVLDGDLRAAIESSLFMYPAVPGLTEALAIPGIKGRRTALSHPLANLVGDARLDEETVDATVDRVREVSPAETIAASEMMGKAYGLPSDITEMFNRLIASVRSRGYFAYLDSDAPVAWSYLVYLDESPIVLLGGAATLSEVRGKGLYSALVKKRLDDARADGREAAVIQADRDTSAPICAKLGFRELCSLEVFGWMPD